MRDAGRSCPGERCFLELRFHWPSLSTLCPVLSSCTLPFTSSHSFTSLSRMRTIASDVFSISVSVKALATFSPYISWFSHPCPLLLRPISHLLPFSQTPQTPILSVFFSWPSPSLVSHGPVLTDRQRPRREQVALSHPLLLDSYISKSKCCLFESLIRGSIADLLTSILHSSVFLGLKPTENESWSWESW